ncbi:hypothetical protein [Lysinibacillus sp. NPDC093692]|uniref:hypothetical protein n=1 Tax=Lysinibacillus sp. NPDC093692 TaxID=3390578 RepID=UPI003D01655E
MSLNNRDTAKQLITEQVGDDNYYFTVNKVYNQFMGSLDGGVFLSQLIYWSDHAKRSDGFFYKTAKEWHEEIYISNHQINKHTKKLRELDILDTKKIKANGSPTIHYKVDIDRLTLCLSSFLKNLEMEIKNIENGNSKISKSKSGNLKIETQNFENGNSKNRNSISKNTENEIENIENGNSNIPISLTKITTKTTTENTQEITSKDFNNDFKTENTTDKTDKDSFNAPNITNSVDREKEEKKKEKTVVGQLVHSPVDSNGLENQSLNTRTRSEQIASIEKSIQFTFDTVDENVYKEISGWLMMYDYESIMKALQETAQLEEPPTKLSSHILNMLNERKKARSYYNEWVK